jgi:hypothetical protein
LKLKRLRINLLKLKMPSNNNSRHKLQPKKELSRTLDSRRNRNLKWSRQRNKPLNYKTSKQNSPLLKENE